MGRLKSMARVQELQLAKESAGWEGTLRGSPSRSVSRRHATFKELVDRHSGDFSRSTSRAVSRSVSRVNSRVFSRNVSTVTVSRLGSRGVSRSSSRGALQQDEDTDELMVAPAADVGKLLVAVLEGMAGTSQKATSLMSKVEQLLGGWQMDADVDDSASKVG